MNTAPGKTQGMSGPSIGHFEPIADSLFTRHPQISLSINLDYKACKGLLVDGKV